MEQSTRDLYARYLRAVEFFNTQVERKYASVVTRAAFRINALSDAEFPGWWKLVCADEGTKARWLERFADPEGAFARSCQQISEELDQIWSQRAA